MVEFSYKRRNKQSDTVHTSTRERAHARPATSLASTNRKVCFSFAAYACTVIAHLSKCNIPITKGLSDEEFQQIQSKFGFDFPPDLRSILQEGLPVGVGFPNWRSSSDKQLLSMINLPAKGLCHEVSKGTFWCKHWGPRPDSIDDAVRVARKAFKLAPVLVPIYSHCYIPCFPNLSGNPILFVFEKDVFYCGYDLADFFEREVFIPLRSSSKGLKGPEWDATILGASRPKCLEKQKIMSSINEKMAMESKLKSYCNKEDGLLSHGYIPGGHRHSQYQNPHQYNLSDHTQDPRYHRNLPHHRSVKEVNWEILNQRLLAELQNADANDQWTYRREDIGARYSEVLSRKSLSEEPLHPFERPPKSLVRSAGNSPRMGQHIMSRYAYFHEKPLPAKVLAQFTIAAPPWAAKMARHIPMWSELVENKENLLHDSNVAQMQESNVKLPVVVKKSILNVVEGKESLCDDHVVQSKESPRDLHVLQSKESVCDVHVVHSKKSPRDLNVLQREESPWESNVVESKESLLASINVPMPKLESKVKLSKEYVKRQEEQGAQVESTKPSKRWLVLYFKDMEKRLRRGGWNEDEIEEMMVAALPPNNEFLLHKETQEDIQDALNASANAMSLSLQEAGWSVPDVLEILSLDMVHPKGMHINNTAKNKKSDLKTDMKMAGKLSDFLSNV